MSQKLFDDKIGTLSHSAGNITMAASPSSPARLTIGGQQYSVTANLVVALPSLTANARYQVFAVQTAGVVSIVISTNENSIGPVGYSRWKLIGSLYANGLTSVAFGSFVNIKGAPNSEATPYNLSITGVSVNPTKGGTIITDLANWKRDGSHADITYSYYHTSAGTTGTGIYLFSLPGLSIDSSKIKVVADANQSNCGTCNGYSAVTNVVAGTVYPYSATQLGIQMGNELLAIGPVASTFMTLANVTAVYNFSARVPIVGWSNTPIEDL